MKKILFTLISISTFIFGLQTITFSEEYKIDNETTNEIFNQTGFPINDLKIPQMKKLIKIRLSAWVGAGGGAIRTTDFPSLAKKKEIENTPSIILDTLLSNELRVRFSLAKFESLQDSKLAFADARPVDPPYDCTLFSGQTIDDALIYTAANTRIHGKERAWSVLFYKNWLCIIDFSAQNLKRDLNDIDYKLIDSCILSIKSIIDKL